MSYLKFLLTKFIYKYPKIIVYPMYIYIFVRQQFTFDLKRLFNLKSLEFDVNYNYLTTDMILGKRLRLLFSVLIESSFTNKQKIITEELSLINKLVSDYDSYKETKEHIRASDYDSWIYKLELRLSPEHKRRCFLKTNRLMNYHNLRFY